MDKGVVKQSVLNILRGVLFSLVFSVLLVLILAIVAKYTDISEKTVTIINQVIKIVALFFGIFLGFKGQKRGLLTGLIIGLLYTILSFAIFSLISGSLDFSTITLYDFLIGLGAGAVSGILTVNLKGLRHKKAA